MVILLLLIQKKVDVSYKRKYVHKVLIQAYPGKSVCLFVFVALCPKSTAMVIAGRSVHLTTLFPGQA